MDQNTINIVIISSLITMLIVLVFSNIKFWIQNKKMVNALVQTTLDKMTLEDGLDKLSQEYELMTGNGSDGFIKFLSESREWAFNYIEEVQSSIKSLSEAMALGDETQIAKAYAELVKHLPKEEEK